MFGGPPTHGFVEAGAATPAPALVPAFGAALGSNFSFGPTPTPTPTPTPVTALQNPAPPSAVTLAAGGWVFGSAPAPAPIPDSSSSPAALGFSFGSSGPKKPVWVWQWLVAFGSRHGKSGGKRKIRRKGKSKMDTVTDAHTSAVAHTARAAAVLASTVSQGAEAASDRPTAGRDPR